MKTKLPWVCVLAAGLALTGMARAAQPANGQATSAAASTPFGVAPVSDAALSTACGGYDLGDGLLVSFGISRLVYVNGGLVAGVSVNLPDLSHLDKAQAGALAALLDGVTVVRNGPGNSVDPVSFNHASGAIVIQNSLDNQRIQAFTTLDVGVKNLKLFNALNLGNTLQSALIHSRGQ